MPYELMGEIVNPSDAAEKIKLADFFDKVEKSIAYSEKVAEESKNQPAETEEERARKRAEIKKRLLGE